MFKVGSQLFTAAGPQIVRDILAHDSKVFLDLKFHDIPHQVAGAARSAAELGVSLFTIHASGGSEMMRRAVDSVNEVAAKTGVRSKVLAISVLTSIDATILSQIGVTSTPSRIGAATREARRSFGCRRRSRFTAGDRIHSQDTSRIPSFSSSHPESGHQQMNSADQKRVATPAAAIAAGASYLVVGRPITERAGSTRRGAENRRLRWTCDLRTKGTDQ